MGDKQTARGPRRLAAMVRSHPRLTLGGSAVAVLVLIGALAAPPADDDDATRADAELVVTAATTRATELPPTSAVAPITAAPIAIPPTTVSATGLARATVAAATTSGPVSTVAVTATRTFDLARSGDRTCDVGRALQVGESGDDVRCLQARLNAVTTAGAPLTTDGVFGQQTAAAVRALQAAAGLTVDGIAGPQTLSALEIWNPDTVIAPAAALSNCSAAYPDVCIPPGNNTLNCDDVSYRRFTVLPPDPHHFDADDDGVGCESG